MKKIFVLIIILCLFGCGQKNQESNQTKLKDKFLEYSKDYYEKYSVKGFDKVDISLSHLRQANEKTKTNYDLSMFNKCEDSSYISFTINSDTKKIDKTEYFLNCK